RDEVAELAVTPVRLRANVYLVAADGASMVRVPGGTFRLGSAEAGAAGAELAPARTVALLGFLIDRVEVSNARYERFLAAWRAAGAVHRCGRDDLDHQPDPA